MKVSNWQEIFFISYILYSYIIYIIYFCIKDKSWYSEKNYVCSLTQTVKLWTCKSGKLENYVKHKKKCSLTSIIFRRNLYSFSNFAYILDKSNLIESLPSSPSDKEERKIIYCCMSRFIKIVRYEGLSLLIWLWTQLHPILVFANPPSLPYLCCCCCYVSMYFCVFLFVCLFRESLV